MGSFQQVKYPSSRVLSWLRWRFGQFLKEWGQILLPLSSKISIQLSSSLTWCNFCECKVTPINCRQNCRLWVCRICSLFIQMKAVSAKELIMKACVPPRWYILHYVIYKYFCTYRNFLSWLKHFAAANCKAKKKKKTRRDLHLAAQKICIKYCSKHWRILLHRVLMIIFVEIIFNTCCTFN